MTFAKRLKWLRNEAKLTQQELSNILEISRSTLAGYEAENKQPDYETLKIIADHFNVSIDYLLGRTDNPLLSEKKKDETAKTLTDDFIELLIRHKFISKKEELSSEKAIALLNEIFNQNK